jgi:hypothetical protein
MAHPSGAEAGFGSTQNGAWGNGSEVVVRLYLKGKKSFTAEGERRVSPCQEEIEPDPVGWAP